MGESGSGSSGKIVGDVDYRVELTFDGVNDLRVIEAQIDAFMGASEVKDLSLILRVNPATFGALYRDGLVVFLTAPAVHEVFRLNGCKWVTHGSFVGTGSRIGSIPDLRLSLKLSLRSRNIFETSLFLACRLGICMVSVLMSKPSFPAAMDAPEGEVVVLSESLMADTVEASRKSPRKRMILPLHKSHGDSLHRMMNIMQPGTYIRPHRHSNPPKAESIVVLRGGLWFVVFSDEGQLEKAWKLAPGLGDFGVDIEPGVFHSFLVTEPDTVIFEVKPGPYERASDKDFAAWAPAEGESGVAKFQEQLMRGVEALAD